MPELSEFLYDERDVRNLPDFTQTKYEKAKRLAGEIFEERIFHLVSEDVYNADTIDEIISILQAALWLQRSLIFIVLRKGKSGMMN